MKTVFIVESPTKVKTIAKYLGPEYDVIATYGHIRQLDTKVDSIDKENDFELKWQSVNHRSKNISALKKSIENAKSVILATDPDREGEAISWHVIECFVKNKKFNNMPIKRISFNSINKQAIISALQNTRDLDMDLINAYKARVALDYMVGFGISPILWRKLPGAKSAGRVQSVALRMICEREQEIDMFISRQYFDIKCIVHSEKLNENFEPNVKFETFNIHEAEDFLSKIPEKITITNIKEIKKSKNPPAPFITSTLQQEAYRKLGFNTAKTMKIAQSLYEPCKIGSESLGLITYMRTDSTAIISSEFKSQLQGFVKSKYNQCVPRENIKKGKNSQEAHECIRPSEMLEPLSIKQYLNNDQFALYDLIWKRTLAYYMNPLQTITYVYNCDIEQISISHTIISDIGYDILYKSDPNSNPKNIKKNISIGDIFDIKDKSIQEHFTKPPARYSEASLIKSLEELGIGRPSTYAYIVKVLNLRTYTKNENGVFKPTAIGRFLIFYLDQYFNKYIEYEFTSNMESNLDQIALGTKTYKSTLANFWQDFHVTIESAKNIQFSEVLNNLFNLAYPGGPIKCSKCSGGNMVLKYSKYGIFLGCNKYPDCKNILQCFKEISKEEDNILYSDNDQLILVKDGPYSEYIVKQDAISKENIKTGGLYKWVKKDTLNNINVCNFILDKEYKINENTSLQYTKYGVYVIHKTNRTIFGKDIQSALMLTEKEIKNIINNKKNAKSNNKK